VSLSPSAIPYLDFNWPVVQGCSGRGCKAHCWAKAMAKRFGRSFEPTFHPEHLGDLARHRTPAVIGVAFGGDLFDEAIMSWEISETVGRIEYAPWHTYILTTKQVERLAGFPWDYRYWGWRWPDSCWVGVSVCDQEDADRMIPTLLRVPAAHRWVSIEPMIGPIEFPASGYCGSHGLMGAPLISAVVLGGESGPEARPLDLAWVRAVRDQCFSAGVHFCYKQSSGLHPEHFPLLDGVRHDRVPWREAP
jgi:protein gp37